MRGIPAAWVIAAVFLAPSAIAQTSPLSLRIDVAEAWDSNVFRLPEAAADPQQARGLSGKSDRITTTTVGLNFVKAYSQQHLALNASQTFRRYGKFTSLNTQNLSYGGDWQWHVTPYLSGSIQMDSRETPVPFDETRQLDANTVVATNRSFAIRASPFGSWQLSGRVLQTERKYAKPIPELPDFSQNGWEAGLRYTAASQSSISLLRRSQRGTGTSQATGTAVALGTGEFTFDETELLAAWPVSGISTLNGRLARIERRHSDAPERDFSGTEGEFSLVWTPAGRLSMTLSAQRRLAPFIQATRSSYFVRDTLTVAPALQLSEKVRLTAAASREMSAYLGGFGAQTAPDRRDTLRSTTVSADWSPLRDFTFRASLRRDLRSSNDAQFRYESTVATVNASLSF